MSGPLRVGLDYRPALLGRGGIARSVRELARSLAALGELDCRAFGHSLARARWNPAGAPKLHRLPLPGRGLPALARIGLGADRLCGRVDVFHWTDYVYPPVNRARTVMTIHDLAFAEDPRFHGEQSAELFARTRTAAAECDRIVAPTHATAAAIERHLGIAADRVAVIPFGVDHVRVPPAEPCDLDRPYLLAVGTIEPRKNHRRLLQAWRQLGRDRPHLVVIGEIGWEVDDVVVELARADADREITWLRTAGDRTLARYLADAQALVYPSLLEGFGFPPLEALAVGTPVLASDIAALREVLGDCADYCDPESVESIAAGLERIRAAPPERIEAGERRAAELTWHRCAERHARLYREVAS